MGNYANLADVSERLIGTYPTGFSATTKPTSTRVDLWINEGESLINNCLNAIDITTPITTVAGKAQLGIIIANYAEGRVRQTLASTGGDGKNDDGKDLIKGLNETCQDIMRNAQMWGEMLAQGGGGVRRLFGHSTDDVDGRTTSSFKPTFTKGQDW